jgi:predicted DCC family thiol-disulfide oxidoreductase YuxK
MEVNARAAAPKPYIPGMRTTAPGGSKIVVLYDGLCRFCTGSAKKLQRLGGKSRLETVSFQEEGVLERFPGIGYDALMKRMHVVMPDGRVFAGAEAVTRVLAALPVVGPLAFGYYVPGIRQLAELTYDTIAKNRYRIAGKSGACEGGTCHLHT